MSEAVSDELGIHVLDRLGRHVAQRRRERQLRYFVLPLYITCRDGRRSHRKVKGGGGVEGRLSFVQDW